VNGGEPSQAKFHLNPLFLCFVPLLGLLCNPLMFFALFYVLLCLFAGGAIESVPGIVLASEFSTSFRRFLTYVFFSVGVGVSNPFGDLKLASFEPLKALTSRSVCPKCNAKRKFFCYDCYLPLVKDPALTPHVDLPIICDVVHYATESQSKSTALHAKVMAGDSVRIHPFPSETLHEWDPEDTVLLFPSPGAVSVKDLDFKKVKHVVFLECQWHNAKRILAEPKIARLPHVKIHNYETRFWRWQNVGNDCLATIEAIYYFYKEYVTAIQGSYNGEMDNLLYYFAFLYQLVQDAYKTTGREFKRIKGFINDDPATSHPALDKKPDAVESSGAQQEQEKQQETTGSASSSETAPYASALAVAEANYDFVDEDAFTPAALDSLEAPDS